MSILEPSPNASLEGFLSKDWAIVLETNSTTMVIIGILFGMFQVLTKLWNIHTAPIGFQVAAYIVSMHVLMYAGHIPPCVIIPNLCYSTSQRGLKNSNARRVLALVSSFMILCSGIILGTLLWENHAQIQLLTIRESSMSFSLGQPVPALTATVASSLIVR